MRRPCFPAETYAFHALGLLDHREQDDINEHLRLGCETCAGELEGSADLWFSVGNAAGRVGPPRRLRRKIMHSAAVPRAWWWRPLPLLAAGAILIVLFSAGLIIGRNRSRYVPSIAFMPVYPATQSITKPAAAPAPQPEIVVREVTKEVKELNKQVAHPPQAVLIESLRLDLRRQNQQQQADLAQQRTGAEGEVAEVRKQLAVSTAHAADLERQVAHYRILVDSQRKLLSETVKIADMLSDPVLRMVHLRATEKDRFVEGHAAIAAGSQMVFYASHLPALPANRTYQLWLIRSSNSPVASAGIFNPDASGNGGLQVRDRSLLRGVTAMAVTDEPSGGSTLPTGHKWLIGS